jgi:hypothetical protein
MTQSTAQPPTAPLESLVWVIVDGMPRHISEFAALAPRMRPEALCPHCEQRLTLKLGKILRHHAAHRPNADCAAVHPETALHLNCKLALAQALRTRTAPNAVLTFRMRCAGSAWEDCDRVATTVWSDGWDDVRVEHRLGDARRPDIVLLRQGREVAAIEIVVSHAMAEEKAGALASARIPWVEIDAEATLVRAGDWKLDLPVDVRRAGDVRPWRCAVHAGMFSMQREAARVRETLHDAPDTTLRSARVVDLYRPSGVRERIIYRLVHALGEGSATLRLSRGGLEIATAPAEPPSGGASGSHILQLAFRDDVARLRGDDGTFADSPMRWAGVEAAEFIVHEAVFDRRLPDPTVLATTYPRRWFFAPSSGRWFLPAEMRDVRWDRDANDVFAPHPAWLAMTARQSRHPAPEGSWTTLIFARRPSLAAFGRRFSAVEIVRGVARLDVPLDEQAGRSRALVVIEREMDDGVIAAMTRDATIPGDALWISHPRDWRPALSSAAWLAGGSDPRGRGAVVLDGVGVFRAPAFLREVASDDARLAVSSVRERMAARVARLAARHRSTAAHTFSE